MKISERMKKLQDLVPNLDKVTGELYLTCVPHLNVRCHNVCSYHFYVD